MSLHVGCCLSKVLAEVVVVVGDDGVASACRFGFCVVKLAAKGSCVYVDASRLHCVSRPCVVVASPLPGVFFVARVTVGHEEAASA